MSEEKNSHSICKICGRVNAKSRSFEWKSNKPWMSKMGGETQWRWPKATIIENFFGISNSAVLTVCSPCMFSVERKDHGFRKAFYTSNSRHDLGDDLFDVMFDLYDDKEYIEWGVLNAVCSNLELMSKGKR